MTDLVTLGLTLDQLGLEVGIAGSQLSLMENGRREPRLSLLQSIAATLGIETADLLDPRPPTARAAMEIELERMQRSAVYAGLGLPTIRPSRTMPDDNLEALVGLHRELSRRAKDSR